MPRDNMASLVQRVARQARLTFRPPGGSGSGSSSSNGPRGGGDGGGNSDASAAGSAAAPSPPPASPRRYRALLRSHQLYTPASAPCRLSPHADNLHQIDAVGGPAAFLDILAPPYDPERGRDCHYYRLGDGQSLGPDAEHQGLPREVWLQETPQAPDFWCGGEPYPGPRVSP
ncbi:PREDICTED: 2-aminoethanethiol dioxygenase [Gekko japonicus]|uniref:2-aminoethanethiol dioxygenase n=1 Tax=Gekko japonicus TaxID=146911 RepID=A0ABM1K6K7_GEKJA|nr:PREDICTED: 2-aminoethanethiol dioxygenase [Gekko japonicus]